MPRKGVTISVKKLRELIDSDDRSIGMIAKDAKLDARTLANYASGKGSKNIDSPAFFALLKALAVGPERLKADAVEKLPTMDKLKEMIEAVAAAEGITPWELVIRVVGGVSSEVRMAVDDDIDWGPVTPPGAPAPETVQHNASEDRLKGTPKSDPSREP